MIELSHLIIGVIVFVIVKFLAIDENTAIAILCAIVVVCTLLIIDTIRKEKDK